MGWPCSRGLPALRVLPGVHSAETPGRNLAHYAASLALAGVYDEGAQRVPSSALSRRPGLGADLWAGGEALVAAEAA